MSIKKIRDKITHLESKLFSLSAILAVIAFSGKGLGLLKVHLFARYFTDDKYLDIFYAAFALPDFIFTLLVVGTMNAALVPIFIKILKNKDQKLLHQTLVTTTLLIFGAMIFLLGIVYFKLPQFTDTLFAQPDVTRELGISFVDKNVSQAEYKTLFIQLSRLMLISPIMLAISSVFGAYLQAHKRFISTAMAPAMYNVGILAGIFYFIALAPSFDIFALGYSVIFGTILHFITQTIGLINLHEKEFYWSFKINNYVEKIVKLSIPRMIGLAVEQIAILFNTFWAFTLGKGMLSVFKFASTIYLLPIDLISGIFLQVIFPRLNEKAQEDDKYHSLNKLYWRTLIFILLISVPVVILLTVLRVPVTRLAFGASTFSWTATIVTSLTLTFLTPAILFQSIAALNIRTFYSINNTIIPFFISIIGVALNIALSIIFTNFFSHYHDIKPIIYNPEIWFDHIPQLFSYFFTKNGSFAAVAGLAFGITVGLLFEVLASFLFLSKKVGLMAYAKSKPLTFKSLKKISIAGISSFIVSYIVYKITDGIVFDTTKIIGVVGVSLVTGTVVLISYVLIAKQVIMQYVDMNKIQSKIKELKRNFIF